MKNSNKLKAKVLELLRGNTRYGFKDGKKYAFTTPSPKTYPFQWFWDSCFSSIVWTHFDVERAKKEIKSLLIWQNQDGFIPHVIFWDQKKAVSRLWHYLESKPWIILPLAPVSFLKPKTTAEMQPPIIAQSVERIYEIDRDESFLQEVFPSLVRYYKWLSVTRDPDRDGLISIIAPMESGQDFSPAYDSVLGLKNPNFFSLTFKGRGTTFLNKIQGYDLSKIFNSDRFAVEDVLVNSCYIQNLRCLNKLAKVLDEKEVATWAYNQAKKSTEALLSKSYDNKRKIFWNLYGKAETKSRVLTNISLMPLILSHLPKSIAKQMVERHILQSDEFWLPFPLPSVAKCEPEFRADSRLNGISRIWRGTTWININWFLIHGLRQHGFGHVADIIKEKSIEMVVKNGFREYFNPMTGEGFGAKNFGWSTLVIDM